MDCMRQFQFQVLWIIKIHKKMKLEILNPYYSLNCYLPEKMSHLQVGTISSSTSLVHKDHSNWIAVIGWTAWARLIVAAEASERPMYFILPSSTNFFSSPIWLMARNKFRTQTKSLFRNKTKEKVTKSLWTRAQTCLFKQKRSKNKITYPIKKTEQDFLATCQHNISII